MSIVLWETMTSQSLFAPAHFIKFDARFSIHKIETILLNSAGCLLILLHVRSADSKREPR